jgi:lysine 2,3-aminomutase
MAARWQQQLAQTVRDGDTLRRHIHLSSAESATIKKLASRRPFAIPLPFLQLFSDSDEACALRRQMLPRLAELEHAAGETADPLAEVKHSVAPGLVHRYPDRVLLLTTGACAGYCRFCTRARIAGQLAAKLSSALQYIGEHREVREVILSGGDPLMLDDAFLEDFFVALRNIGHVEVIRIHTRIPVFLPSRVTGKLVQILRRARPLYVLIHANHVRELGDDCRRAVGRLVDAGIGVLSQTVLLRDINADVDTLTLLFNQLLRFGVTPYYLHHCDFAHGTAHFRVPIARGLELFDALRERNSGLSTPRYVIDLPEGGGKVVLARNRIVATEEGGIGIYAHDGRLVKIHEDQAVL